MTDWMPYSQAGSLSTLQCVTTWRGSEAGTYPLNVLWAGTDGTLWQSTTDPHSEFAQMFTDADTVVTHMAVDDRGTIYGINSSGKPVQYGTPATRLFVIGSCTAHRRFRAAASKAGLLYAVS